MGMLNLICSLNFDLGNGSFDYKEVRNLNKIFVAKFHSTFDDYLASMLMRRKRSLYVADSDDEMDRFYLTKRNGLAMTCCTKSCTLNELRGFC